MGLLPEDPPATTYLPRDFTSSLGAKLPLQGGARLGRERTLVFDNTPLHARDSTYYASRHTLLPSPPSPAAAPAPSVRIGRDAFSAMRPATAGGGKLLNGSASSSIKESSSESLGEESSQAPPLPSRAPSDSASAATMTVVRDTSSEDVEQQQQQPQQQPEHSPQSWKSRAVKRLSVAAGLEPHRPAPAMLSSAQAEEMMRDAFALYLLRKWMRKHMRNKQRLQEVALAAGEAQLSEVQVEVRN
jgi:hypothetical protein